MQAGAGYQVTGTGRHRLAVLWRTLLYALLVLSPITVRAAAGGAYGRNAVAGTGLVLGMTGFAVLVLQPVLSCRFRWIERPFGLDRLLRIHRITGVAGALLVTAHPLLLALGRDNWGLLLSFDLPWYHLAARATLAVLLLFGIAALFHSRFRIPFQWWFRGHTLLTPVILAGVFMHSYTAAVRYQPIPLRLLWFALLGTGVFSYLHLTLYRRFGGRLRPWKVAGVSRIGRDVWDITMEPPGGRRVFEYLPGQFLFVTLLRGRGLPTEEHPFTISSSPTQKGHVSISPKESGDYTATVGKTEVGDGAVVMAPYGRFSHLLRNGPSRMVFAAGGIGITPMMSMLRYMRDTGDRRKVLLLYGCRTEEDLVFRDELEGMSGSGEAPELEMVPVLSSPGASWEGETGYVDGEKLDRLAGDLDASSFYICGPPPMMEKICDALRERGVEEENIHMERFSL